MIFDRSNARLDMMLNRLLLITPDFPPNKGGVARYLQLLADYFSPRMTVITTGLFFRFLWPRWMASVRLLIKKRLEYDLAVTSHVLPFGTAMWMASWITKKPYIVIVHGFDVRLAARRLIKRALARQVLVHARVVVANSQALAREVANTFHVPLPLVIYPCVDKSSRSREVFNFFQLLTVGRLVRRKGHEHVLMALSQLKQTGRMPEFRYTIAGNGPMRQSLEELAGQLHLDEVNFVGEVSDEEKNQLYAQADLFVMPVLNDPIDKEGFGLVFLEAAQFGVPSISTNIEGIDEAILDGKTGVLVEPGNLQALEGAIAHLVEDQAYREQLGAQAKERVEMEFTCQQQFSKLQPYL
jgi:phosphatidylinositol alpha-1,6-mannosyltransferase